MTIVLALDLASQTGWAVGPPGGDPTSGTMRFGGEGRSHEATFAGALRWMSDKCMLYRPTVVVWEAPLPTSFKGGSTNINTSTLLFGLPAIIGAVAHLKGIYDVRKARTTDVRHHFIGSNPKGKDGKKLVQRQCRAMGFDVADDNEADAIATWFYMCALIDPKLAVVPTPLPARQQPALADQRGDVDVYAPTAPACFIKATSGHRTRGKRLSLLVRAPGLVGGDLEREPDRRVPLGLLGRQAIDVALQPRVIERERLDDPQQRGNVWHLIILVAGGVHGVNASLSRPHRRHAPPWRPDRTGIQASHEPRAGSRRGFQRDPSA
jgi:hypothetical protein